MTRIVYFIVTQTLCFISSWQRPWPFCPIQYTVWTFNKTLTSYIIYMFPGIWEKNFLNIFQTSVRGCIWPSNRHYMNHSCILWLQRLHTNRLNIVIHTQTKWSVCEGTWPGAWESLVQVQPSTWPSAWACPLIQVISQTVQSCQLLFRMSVVKIRSSENTPRVV